MNDYLSVTEYAKKHGMDASNIRKLIAQGRILGATKVGNQWCIPADAPRPEDKRVATGKFRGWRKGGTVKPRQKLSMEE